MLKVRCPPASEKVMHPCPNINDLRSCQLVSLLRQPCFALLHSMQLDTCNFQCLRLVSIHSSMAQCTVWRNRKTLAWHVARDRLSQAPVCIIAAFKRPNMTHRPVRYFLCLSPLLNRKNCSVKITDYTAVSFSLFRLPSCKRSSKASSRPPSRPRN